MRRTVSLTYQKRTSRWQPVISSTFNFQIMANFTIITDAETVNNTFSVHQIDLDTMLQNGQCEMQNNSPMEKKDIKSILDAHQKWISNEDGGARADLTGANLTGADLYGANLTGAKGYFGFGPMPTSGRIVHCVWGDDGWAVQAGCFWGSLDELEARVKAKHNCPIYLGMVAFLRTYQPEQPARR
jgi:hypothetical protein